MRVYQRYVKTRERRRRGRGEERKRLCERGRVTSSGVAQGMMKSLFSFRDMDEPIPQHMFHDVHSLRAYFQRIKRCVRGCSSRVR